MDNVRKTFNSACVCGRLSVVTALLAETSSGFEERQKSTTIRGDCGQEMWQSRVEYKYSISRGF